MGLWPGPGKCWFLFPHQQGPKAGWAWGRVSPYNRRPDSGCQFRKHPLETPETPPSSELLSKASPRVSGAEGRIGSTCCQPPAETLRLSVAEGRFSQKETPHWPEPSWLSWLLPAPSLHHLSQDLRVSQTWEVAGMGSRLQQCGDLLLQIVRGADILIVEAVCVQQGTWKQ